VNVIAVMLDDVTLPRPIARRFASNSLLETVMFDPLNTSSRFHRIPDELIAINRRVCQPEF